MQKRASDLVLAHLDSRLQKIKGIIRIIFFVALACVEISSRSCVAGPLRILALGDSITFGYPGTNGGYRGELFRLLSTVTTNFLFVGSSTNQWLVSTLPKSQWANEGHSSYGIDNVFTNLNGFDNSVFLTYGGADRNPNGGHWLDGIASGANARAAVFPDIILLLIGANERDTPAGAQGRLDRLLSKLVTMRSAAQILVARITPITDTAGHRSFVGGYNSAVDAVVAKYAVTNNVSSVDLNTGFPANGLSGDGLHPSDVGYNWIANRWFEKIVARPNLSSVMTNGAVELDWTRTHVGWQLEAQTNSNGIAANGWGAVASATGTNRATVATGLDGSGFFRLTFR